MYSLIKKVESMSKQVFVYFGHVLTSNHANVNNMGHATEKMSIHNKDKMPEALFE